MNAKKLVPLIIAVVSGLLVLFVIMKIMSNKDAVVKVLPTRHTQVVVAKAQIDAGMLINEEMLTTGELAVDSPPDSVFREPAELIGRVPLVPIAPGQVITSTALSPKGTAPGLSPLIPMGMRAITLEINEVTGVAGYILPGSHVDIIQTVRDSQTAEPITRVIAQNIKVAACGVRHGAEGDGGGRSITVFCTPEQAELLELANISGRSRMALRPSNDPSRTNIQAVTVSDLTGRSGTKSDPLAVAHVAAAPLPTTQPAVVAATTQPTVAVQSQPAEPEMWTIQVVRGAQETYVSFPLPKEPEGSQPDTRAPVEQIDH